MRKLYNTFIDLARNFKNFFTSVSILSKPQVNFITNCIIGMINAESVVTSDIIKKIPVDYFDESLFSSKEKKFYRFFNNSRFDPYDFYDSIIQYIISNFDSKNAINWDLFFPKFIAFLLLIGQIFIFILYRFSRN